MRRRTRSSSRDGYLNQRVAVPRPGDRPGRSPLVRLREPARRTTTSTQPAPSRLSSFRGPTHLCRRLGLTGWSTSATGPATGSRSSRPRASSWMKASSPRTPLWGASTWDVAFSPDPEQTYIYISRRLEPEGPRGAPRDVGGALHLRYGRDDTRASSSAPTASRRTRRATSTRRETFEGKRIQKFRVHGDGPCKGRG